jgi:hypothetical protein
VVLFLWGAPSDERTGLQFVVQLLNGRSRTEPVTIVYCLIWDSPQPGGPGSHIYILQEQGGAVITPGIGFHLRRLLRHAGLRRRYSNPPSTWRVRSPYIYPSGTGWPSPKSKSRYDRRSVNSMSWWIVHVVLEGLHPNEFQSGQSVSQSVSMSRHRAHSGTCDQILLSVWRLLSKSFCLVSVGRPLWRQVGSVICHSQSVVIYQYLHQAFTLHMFYSSAMYILVQYIQGFFQSRLGIADYALLVIMSSNYRSSLDTSTFV